MTYTDKEPAIEVEGLRKVYRSLVAVDDVSFVMSRGEAFGFLGPNGAGKSTVVKILTGLVAPTKGTIRILGQPINNREMRRRIGYLPELPTFHKWLRARDFLAFHGHLYGMRGMELEKRSREVLRSEEHTSELQSQSNLVCRLLLEKKNTRPTITHPVLVRRDALIENIPVEFAVHSSTQSGKVMVFTHDCPYQLVPPSCASLHVPAD